jgi:hypothetical protein
MNTEQNMNTAENGGSELNVQLEAKVDWAIIFEDKDRPIELYTDYKTAIDRFFDLCSSWNCHLFKRVDGF